MRKAGAARDIPPPLELACLKALWTLQEANVREVQVALAGRNLAYTTVMTLLERLVRKGAAARRKAGRAFRYSAVISREALRPIALKELLEVYFDGSAEELAEYLRREGPAGVREEPVQEAVRKAEEGLDAALL